MKICFVDNTAFIYDSNSIHSKKLRGAESVLINLSNALNDNGHEITIINNCYDNKIINNVRWININSSREINKFDLVIANGDCRLFKYADAKQNILFSHSHQSIEKFIRKKQLFSYLKYKPKICFLSEYHKNIRSRLLYLFGHINLRWAVDKIFSNANIKDNHNNNLAIFTSRPDRNLKLLIDIWTKLIISKNKELKLLVTENDLNYLDKSIIKRKLSNQNSLISDIMSARICLLPGHKAELFCLAAEEANELCVPIVTLGIGSLSERVEHGITGFIAKNEQEFANYTLKLFSDDDLWYKFRSNLIKKRKINTWDKVAKELINQVI